MINHKEIISLSKSYSIDIFIPGSTVKNKELHIDTLLSTINKSKRKPSLLWNMQPWDNLNVIHAIYLFKIKFLQDLGFNCHVLLFDKLVEKMCQAEGGRIDKQQLNLIVKRNINWIKGCGLEPKRVEFLQESILWKGISFHDFSDKIMHFVHICESNLSDCPTKDIFNNFWELYYEDVIDCDFLITGDKDATNIWGALRKKALKANHINYSPPTLLVFPNLVGLDGKEESPRNIDNLISTNDSSSEIYSKIKNASPLFLKQITELLILPYENNSIIYNNINEKYIYSYEELQKELGNNTIDYCSLIINKFFTKIKYDK